MPSFERDTNLQRQDPLEGNGDIDPGLFHGKAISIGWWTDGDCIYEAGPGALIMSGKDMVSRRPQTSRSLFNGHRDLLRELLDPKIIPQELLEKMRAPLSTFMGIHSIQLSRYRVRARSNDQDVS